MQNYRYLALKLGMVHFTTSVEVTTSVEEKQSRDSNKLIFTLFSCFKNQNRYLHIYHFIRFICTTVLTS